MNFEKIQTELDYYKKLAPVNYRNELDKFFLALRDGKEYNPQFEYEDSCTVQDYERIREEIKECSEKKDRIVYEFLKVFGKVAGFMIAWKKQDYENVSKITGELFGSHKQLSLSEAEEIYKKIGGFKGVSEERYSDKQIGEMFSKEFFKRGLEGWKVEYDGSNGSEVSIYETRKTVVIKKDVSIPKFKLERILCHEIDGHALQAFNAMENEKYSKWFLSYLGTEQQYEGYALFTEMNLLKKEHIRDLFGRYLLLMIATKFGEKNSFFETYKKMFQFSGDEYFSFLASYKAKRGLTDTSNPGCFQKENSYLLGALKMIELVEEDDRNYGKLSQGCIPFSVIEMLEERKNKWEAVEKLNNKNLAYFKKLMRGVLKANANE